MQDHGNDRRETPPWEGESRERQLMRDITFLRGTLEDVRRENDRLHGEHAALARDLHGTCQESAAAQSALHRIVQSRSWRWTAPVRTAERHVRSACSRKRVYRLLGHLRKLWVEMGSPCPRFVRFCRHRILGTLFPALHAPRAPVPSKPPSDVSIVICCEETAEHAEEAIESVLAQTVGIREIVLLDTTDGKSAARSACTFTDWGVRYVPAASHAPLHTIALQATAGSTVLFLPAKNVLHPEYVRCGLSLFASDPHVVISYGELHLFGSEKRQISTPPYLQQTQGQYLTHGCMVRRAALESVASLPSLQRTFEALLRTEWLAARSRGICFVRGETSTAQSERARATLCIALSGRTWAWPLTAAFLRAQTYPHSAIDLVVLDTSQNDAFGKEVEEWLLTCNYRTQTYLREAVGARGLADMERENNAEEVCRACTDIYNRFRNICKTALVFFLEDDVIPPHHAYTRLAASLRPGIVSVSGFYRHRESGDPVAWEWDTAGNPVFAKPGRGVRSIGGNGFGCLAMQGSFLRDHAFRHGPGLRNFDQNFYFDTVYRSGSTALIDWSCTCRHYASPTVWQ